MDIDVASISIENDRAEPQTEEESVVLKTRKEFGPPVLRLRTDIFKKGIVTRAAPITLSRNFIPPEPETADSGFLEFSGFSMDTRSRDPLILVKAEEEGNESDGEVDTSLSSNIAELSWSSDGFLSDSTMSFTSTPRQSASKIINSEDGEDLRKTLARKRKLEADDQISFLSHRIEEKQETIREIENFSKMKISQIEKEIAADKSEIDRIRKGKTEGEVQSKVSVKRNKIEFPVVSEIDEKTGGDQSKNKLELRVKSGNPRRFHEYCELCDVKAFKRHVWQSHLSGKRHRESLQKLALMGKRS